MVVDRNALWSRFAALVPFAPLALFAAMATGACGTVLGDVPDGQLAEDSGVGDTGVPVDSGVPVDELLGAICLVENAVIVDLAVDATNVYWLRAPLPGGGGFAVESCSKKSGDVRQLASLPSRPEALTLSDKYVFWTINDVAGSPNAGVWRVAKQDGPPPTSPFIALGQAGPIAFGNGTLFTATRTGSLFFSDPESNGPPSRGRHDVGNAVNLAVSPSNVYWTKQETSEIWLVAYDTPIASDARFAGRFATPPLQLSYDSSIVYWASNEPAGTVIRSKCAEECQVKDIAVQPTGFSSFAIRNGSLYWTANEGGSGVLHGCTDLARCQGSVSMWKGNAEVTRLAIDDGGDVYFAALRDGDSHIVKRAR